MKYQKELIETANRLVADGKGILAADESNNTIKKRFDAVGVENTEANRAKYRSLLFNAPGLTKYISGVICFEETLGQKDTVSGKTLSETLKEKGLIIGIKVDKGLFELPVVGETITKGFDDLFERSSRFYEMGARFAKWRNVLTIDTAKGLPSRRAITMNAWNLARYALVCQAAGLVPVVEPEVLMDGTHTVEECEDVTRRVLMDVFRALNEYNVLLEGMLLKVNMVVPGAESASATDMSKVGSLTASCLLKTVPAVVPGVVFLSGGQSEKNATRNLNDINKFIQTVNNYSKRELTESGHECASKLWKLSFSYGRALQSSCLKAWNGKDENVESAQKVLLMMARNNWLAAQGKLTVDHENELDQLTKDLSKASLYEKDYKY
ncbi:fructose-bisphosphate aldolase 2 [Theileria orientalis strain Shintoku]|uniref:fructose-bisphosphate aldolase n=1 Tax=Theileria orientalis strain Shintoku TaxID=869250 RepID=J7M4J1_THEOR|nr:fructose-bisphosphate aldolase 2 [Theileria orientalis strain Shintoku]BAM38625.1 fructose-bisphosphate aldolase 2 [Theileria orientalis strain Shintoku]|eukprot:XP_009688926.1 fructose-bisphosphate aldolase 2 [Theileria orientalis strain Shintoku]